MEKPTLSASTEREVPICVLENSMSLPGGSLSPLQESPSRNAMRAEIRPHGVFSSALFVPANKGQNMGTTLISLSKDFSNKSGPSS